MSAIGINHLLTRTYFAESSAIASGLIVIAGTANNQVKLPGAAEAALNIGITVTAAAAAGDPLTVCLIGICRCTVDGTGTAIAVGGFISSKGTNGYGMAWTIANAKYPIAQALEASSAAGDEIAVIIARFAPPAS